MEHEILEVLLPFHLVDSNLFTAVYKKKASETQKLKEQNSE